ncbi:hypothetical protein H5410_051272 [Solanum commersonii]|uniref:Uncharacterized protein n=1 Tax=Solanum commersonii TaxID=4109 RepID=A0A9J5WZI9_SOLCO|nr:hypothetical protein H5410_051272 [Solanum commersonii]
MQVQAQPKCSNALTQRMIPYSHNGSQFKAPESDATLTVTKKNTVNDFTHSHNDMQRVHMLSMHLHLASSLPHIHVCSIISTIEVIEDPSAKLVGIANQLGNPPFGLGSAYWNIRRGCKPFGDLPNGLGNRQVVFSSFFQPLCSFLFDSVHALSLNSNA